MVKKYQEQYYKAIALCDAKGESTEFIAFMLRCILETIKQEIKVTDKVMDKVTDKSTDKILALIEENPTITIPEMMRQLGMSDSGVRKILRNLQKEGRLQRVGANKNGHWEIITTL